ncbi:MAG: rane protein [Frankiales bacterium]|nr:rane protein [Frankiales bacterium]
MTAALLALLAASCFAGATVVQHRSTAVAAQVRPDGLGRLLADPAWLAGLLLGGAALVVQALALRTGRVVVVQPLLLTGVVLALPLGVLLERRRPSWQEWWSAVALSAGLSCALLSAAPAAGTARAGTGPLLLDGAVVLGACAGLRLLATVRPARRAALLGAAGGAASGLAGALLKQAAAPGGARPLVLLAVLLAGGLGLWLTTQAYAAGPLSSSLPALAAGEPAAAVLVGTHSFGEHLAAGVGARAGQLLGCVVVLLAVRALGRAGEQAARPSTSPASSSGGGDWAHV